MQQNITTNQTINQIDDLDDLSSLELNENQAGNDTLKIDESNFEQVQYSDPVKQQIEKTIIPEIKMNETKQKKEISYDSVNLNIRNKTQQANDTQNIVNEKKQMVIIDNNQTVDIQFLKKQFMKHQLDNNKTAQQQISQVQQEFINKKKEEQKYSSDIINEIKESYDLILKMSEHLKNKESFSVFAFKIRHLKQQLHLQQEEICKNIEDNQKILKEVNSEIGLVRDKLQNQDNSDLRLVGLNKEVGLERSETYIENIQQQVGVMDMNGGCGGVVRWVEDYVKLNAQYYRISQSLRIQQSDDTLSLLRKLSSSHIYKDWLIIGWANKQLDGYIKLEEKMRKGEGKLLELFKKQVMDESSGLIQVTSLEDILGDEEHNQKRNERESINKLLSHIHSNESDSTTHVLSNDSPILDDEDEYIKHNQLHIHDNNMATHLINNLYHLQQQARLKQISGNQILLVATKIGNLVKHSNDNNNNNNNNNNNKHNINPNTKAKTDNKNKNINKKNADNNKRMQQKQIVNVKENKIEQKQNMKNEQDQKNKKMIDNLIAKQKQFKMKG